DAREPEGDEAAARLEPQLRRAGLAREQHRRRTVDDLARAPGRDDAVLLERRLQRGELLQRRVTARRLVDGEQDARMRIRDLDGNDLPLEPALVDRGDRAPVRLVRQRV